MHKFSTILIVSNITTVWIEIFYTQNPISRISQFLNHSEADNDDYGHNDDDENNDDDNNKAYVSCFLHVHRPNFELNWSDQTVTKQRLDQKGTSLLREHNI